MKVDLMSFSGWEMPGNCFEQLNKEQLPKRNEEVVPAIASSQVEIEDSGAPERKVAG